MKITSAMLHEIGAMPAEAMGAAIRFLAVQLEAHEHKRGLAAQRQSRFRNAHDSVTSASQKRESNSDITRLARDGDIISNTSLEDINSPLSPRPAEPDGLTAFLQTYPRREGNNDHGSAAKAYAAALKRTDAATLLACAKAYATFCKTSGKTGTQYVKNCRAWLNEDLWKEWLPKAVQASIPVQIIREGTPEWEELKKTRPRLVARDIQTPSGIIRGEYARAA